MRPWETGPPRGAYGFLWLTHRTLAEVAAGVGPDPLDVTIKRGEKMTVAKILAAKQLRGKS